LPRGLPTIDGLRFDGYYQAGRQEALIGGDWYDAFVVGGSVVVSVGDVAGSGLGAAVLMSTVRQIVRATAHVFTDPNMMLDLADRTLRSEYEDVLVTAFVAVIDPQRKSLRYASAGHVPPLLRVGGKTVELEATGLPLGCRDLNAAETRTVTLHPGAQLLLYTDGLVEWSRDIVAGEELLRRRFEDGCERNEPHPARTLVESVLAHAEARDDIAVLIVGLGATPAA
jgi:serine phosphatase RsbU (regulator of sigma subunit)